MLAGCARNPATPTPTDGATPTAAGPSASLAPSRSGAPVAIDPSLLEHLPTQVDGIEVARRPESDAVAAADPVVVSFGEAVVTALAVDPGTDDFAYAAVVRLREGAFTEELFRSWRESFDEGACSQAGGVERTAVTEIDGRDVHVAVCEGGLRTYHAWLPNSRVLVSVSAFGDRRLGELIVQELVD
jgi:hypothetical protein